MTFRGLVIAAAMAVVGACGSSSPGAGAGSSLDAAAGTGAAAGQTGAGGTPPATGAAGQGAAGAVPDASSAGGPGDGASVGADVDATPDASDDGASATAWPAVTDYGAPGPFTVARDMNTGPGGAYDIFRPSTLGAANRRHPIVSWANGTLFSIPDYQKLLEHWASHGLVVIAGHTTTTAGGGTHKAAIDWLVAENARAASPYFGVLDTAHVAASGHSQGGGATLAAGAQKPGPLALTTTLPLMPILSYESDTSIVGKQTAPMLNINATMDTRDPTGAVAMQIYTAAKAELVQAAFIGIHEDAMTAAMFAPTLGWFRFRLMGDTQARAMFYPPGTCVLCRDAAWKQVRYQNVP
ncbi:MAG TPA: hypothetical protein VGK52_14920 [Polyangia bacterium]|jgi:hypothetical protein